MENEEVSEPVDGEANQATDPSTENSQAETNSETPEQEAGDEIPLERIQKTKAYNELRKLVSEQGEKLKAMESRSKRFEAFGGEDSLLQQANALIADPAFKEFMERRQAQSEYGIDPNTIQDPEAKAAIKLVQNIVNSAIEKRYATDVAPLQQQAKKAAFQETFSQMDNKYGNEWHSMKNVMAEIAGTLPKEFQENPSFDNLESLYFVALQRSGKMEEYAGKYYQKTLEAKKAKAMPKRESQTGTPSKKVNSLADAFALAKAQMKQVS